MHPHLLSDAWRGVAHGVPASRVLTALVLTAAGYAVLAGYDLLALAYAGRPLPAGRALFASFVAYGIGQSVGFGALAGASVRWRLWTRWGLTPAEVARGVAFTTTTFWLGVLLVGGGVLATSADAARLVWPHHALLPRLAGALCLALAAAYLSWGLLVRRALVLRGRTLPAPTPRLVLAQAAVSALDWVLAGATLWALLPRTPGLALVPVLGAFMVAQLAGLLSHLPGGVAVFDATALLLLVPRAGAGNAGALGAALVAYRAVYYLLPLALAGAAFLLHELLPRRAALVQGARRAAARVTPATPDLLAVVVFAAGVMLLASGATPGVAARLRWLDELLPLGVIELSHFAASVAGVVLLFLARGLHQRLDAARHVAVAALAVGVAGSLLKGLDWEEALALSAVLLAVVCARREFWRRAALTSEPLTRGWTVAVVAALVGSTWLGLFSYRHVAYAHELWWRFTLRGDAPRFLRATVGAAVAALGVALRRLLRPAPHRPALPCREELDRVRDILQAGARSEANLALLGDKAILLGERRDSFLMYAVRGTSWVVLGDPVGPTDAQRELVQRFRELARRHGGRPVFYGVAPHGLALYAEQGLGLYKLGEEARVSLAEWSLDAPEQKKLRRDVRLAERAGLSFEILPPDGARALTAELRRVSDAWLAHKRTREKGFSLGRFDESYLANFPVAVVRRGGAIVAFANLWSSGDRDELSVDLMRYVPGAAPGLMDYLFAHLIRWGAAEGYRWFNLGMAPLSGLDARSWAWARAGALVYAHGEAFYNFRGLRRFKEKFRPEWRPRFLASPRGLALFGVLADVTALVSGGLAGAVRR
jgi:phosphatidylglycerol lysyltransferase